MEIFAWPRLLLFSVASLELICCEKLHGIEGENFTIKVNVKQPMSESIWKKDKDKVAEWQEEGSVKFYGSLEGRAFFNKENGDLTIFNLQKNDSGTYVFEYPDSEGIIHEFLRELNVSDGFSEPEISCNTTANDNKFRCATDFHLPVNYTWKIGNMIYSIEGQEISISKNHDPSTEVTCSAKYSQTEKSSQINLSQCSRAEEGHDYNKRGAYGIIVAVVLVMVIVLIYLYKKGKIPFGKRRAALNSSEHGLDDNLDKGDNPVVDKYTMERGVNQNDTLKENSSLLNNHTDDCDVNERGMTQDGEGVNGKHLRNSPTSINKDLKS
ncbi:lymphocyte function-associated antigen 3 [Pogoniulus pusillus]|uniref:lymphocyte function-associated antigen 3 n=1 Tax=Pogoniulus pusillus TaxID=488313 RepID=UPI0030B9ACAB